MSVNTHAEKSFEQKNAKIAKDFGLRFAEYTTLHGVLQYGASGFVGGFFIDQERG